MELSLRRSLRPRLEGLFPGPDALLSNGLQYPPPSPLQLPGDAGKAVSSLAHFEKLVIISFDLGTGDGGSDNDGAISAHPDEVTTAARHWRRSSPAESSGHNVSKLMERGMPIGTSVLHGPERPMKDDSEEQAMLQAQQNELS